MTKWVLVSGAGSGIGRAVCRRLVSDGYAPILLGRSGKNLAATQSELGDRVPSAVIQADIRDPEALREGLKKAEIGELHAIIANAGLGGENLYGPEDRWDEVLTTNLNGTYYSVNEALPYLKANRGEISDYRHIVLISSVLARLGVPGYTAYCASKAGLLGLMRAWAASFSTERILVNAICPGWVETEMAKQGLNLFAEGSGKSYDEVYQEQMSRVPLGKMSQPEEIAETVLFLIGGGQTSLTGQTLDVNNGALMP